MFNRRVCVMSAKELNNAESALVHIKMDVALFKVGRKKFPNDCFRIHFLYHLPHASAQPLVMKAGIKIKQVHAIAAALGVYVQCNASRSSAVHVNGVNGRLRVTKHSIDVIILEKVPVAGQTEVLGDCYGKHLLNFIPEIMKIRFCQCLKKIYSSFLSF